MDQQRLYLVEAAQNNLEEIDRAGNPEVSEDIGFQSAGELVTFAVSFLSAEAVAAATERGPSDGGEVEPAELTPEQEAEIDRLAETYHSYSGAYEAVVGRSPTQKVAA